MIPARLKRLARPAVFALRMARVRVGSLLRPAVAWDGRHHPVLRRFAPWTGQSDGRFQIDFLGVRTDPAFREEFAAQPAGPVETDYPKPSSTYFELVFVLESVLSAGSAFTMVELGAGYGPWLVAASRARARIGSASCRLVGVEMDEQHVAWMHEHFRNNDLDPAGHLLLQAAVSDDDGEAWYAREPDVRLRYGVRMVPGARPAGPASGETVTARRIDVRSLLERESEIDLMHVDVQGEEWRVIRRAGELLDAKVRRLLVATHSGTIHRNVRRRMTDAGWRPVYDFGFRSRQRTELGDVYFVDGLLAFENPGMSKP
jgi:FkbM family methyltransferase